MRYVPLFVMLLFLFGCNAKAMTPSGAILCVQTSESIVKGTSTEDQINAVIKTTEAAGGKVTVIGWTCSKNMGGDYDVFFDLEENGAPLQYYWTVGDKDRLITPMNKLAQEVTRPQKSGLKF